MAARPLKVKIVEVGPRDGLQHEPRALSAEVKAALVERLAEAGLPVVETGSFVSPKRVPQMADSGEVYARLRRRPGVAYPALVPNLQGLEAATAAGVEEIALFISASDGFSQRNIGCSVADSLERVAPVARAALDRGMRVRGYLSAVVACPYDGPTDPERCATLAERLMDLGCYEVSLGDTIGVATADQVRRLVARVAARLPLAAIAMHFHDTYGQGVANVLASLEEGVAVFDSSVAGLGGCPFAPGATGNVATEDVLALMDGLGVETGVDIRRVAEAGAWICQTLGRANASRAGRALLAKC